MLTANKILQNRYRIIRELGHGGMGTVYEAIDERVNCLVALKTTRAASAHEAALLANLIHPALPKVTDYFSDEDGYFLVMEYIPGDDFAKLLEIRGRPFSESEVLPWADKLLDLLQYLHGKQLLHRDIKPSNLKLTSEGELFLLDFGLAKGAVGQMPTLTSDKSVHGYTLQFASLEQILKKGTDARSDIYSLGATLYQLLTGVLPIDAYTRSVLIEKQRTDPLPPITKTNARVSAQVASVIHQAMAIEPDKRPTSAREMREALRKAGASRVPVPPISTIPAPQPKPHYWNSRIFIDDDAGPAPVVPTPTPIDPAPVDPSVIPTPPGPSIAKVLLITVGVVLLLTAASVVAVSLQTGRWPWSKGNGNGESSGASNLNTNANTSPVVVTSPSPDKPAAETPSAGSVERNQIGMELVWIPSGSFLMGSDSGDDDEKPAHRVTFSSGFYIGKYEVTQDQWRTIMGNNASYFPNCGGNCPVEYVTWDNVQQFITALNSRDTRFKYRLPSEAEWEYSARGGAPSVYYWGGDLNRACRYENVPDQTGKLKYSVWTTFVNCSDGYAEVAPVGSFLPNGFGLHDMSGNVSEWCEDRYNFDHTGAPADGRVRGQESHALGIPLADGLYKGGAWGPDLRGRADPRPALRMGLSRSQRGNFIGFRVVAIPRTT